MAPLTRDRPRVGLLRSRRLGLTLSLWAISARALADNVDATATTLVQGMRDLRDGQVYSVVPVTELVSINARDLDNPYVDHLSFVFSGWGSLQFGDTVAMPGAGHALGGDLSLAYVQGSEFDDHLQLRLGRQDVIGGAAQVLPIDGASVTVTPWKDFGLTAYGGALVVPRFATATGDAAAGARAFWRPTFDSEVGVSFVDVVQGGLTERQELGVDAHVVPWRWLTLSGYALTSTLEWRLAEASITATVQPLRDLQITADYRRSAPDLFISAASIFSVFAEEQQDEVGGSAAYRLDRWVSFDGDFHGINTEEGWGHRGGLRANFHLGGVATLGLQGRELLVQMAPAGTPAPFMPLTEAGANGYWAATAFGLYRFSPRLFATLDLEAYRFRALVNGQENSLSATLTASYDLTPLWRFTLAGVQSATPLLAQNTEILVKIVFNPTLTLQVRKP